MPRLTADGPDAATPASAAAPAAVGRAPVVPMGRRRAEGAYGTAMQARCALARLIRQAGHREPPRHRAA